MTDTFEPGSVLKGVPDCCRLWKPALCEPETLIECESGAYKDGADILLMTPIHHEILTVHDVLKYSSNIGAVKIAEMLGPGAIV